MAAGTLSMVQIVEQQQERGVWFVFDNYGLMIVPFMIFLIASIAETNRAPFDLPEAESELVAGFMTEYSGFRWALYFLAEYASIFVIGGRRHHALLGRLAAAFPERRLAGHSRSNYAFPVVLFVGSGLLSLRLTERLMPLSGWRGPAPRPHRTGPDRDRPAVSSIPVVNAAIDRASSGSS